MNDITERYIHVNISVYLTWLGVIYVFAFIVMWTLTGFKKALD